MKKVVYHRDGAFPITLLKTDFDEFRIEYGEQSWKGDYAFAAVKLGEVLMHCLTCEGKL